LAVGRSGSFAVGAIAVSLPLFWARYAAGSIAPGEGFIAWLTAHPSQDMLGLVGRGFHLLSLPRALVGLAHCTFPLAGGAPTVLKLILTARAAPQISGWAWVEFGVASLFAAALLACALVRALGRAAPRRTWAALAVGILCGGMAAVYWLGSDPQFW